MADLRYAHFDHTQVTPREKEIIERDLLVQFLVSDEVDRRTLGKPTPAKVSVR